MGDLLTSDVARWLVPGAIVALLLVWFWYRRRNSGSRLKKVLNEIGYDRIDDLVIPNGDEGEIQIDQVVTVFNQSFCRLCHDFRIGSE